MFEFHPKNFLSLFSLQFVLPESVSITILVGIKFQFNLWRSVWFTQSSLVQGFETHLFDEVSGWVHNWDVNSTCLCVYLPAEEGHGLIRRKLAKISIQIYQWLIETGSTVSSIDPETYPSDLSTTNRPNERHSLIPQPVNNDRILLNSCGGEFDRNENVVARDRWATDGFIMTNRSNS